MEKRKEKECVIDGEELIMALETNDYEAKYYLDRKSGDIFLKLMGDYTAENDNELDEKLEKEPDRYVCINPINSSEGWQVMADFVESLPDSEIKDHLLETLNLKHPFRSFKSALLNYPNVRSLWFVFHHNSLMQIAQDWLDDNHISAILRFSANKRA